MYSTYLTPNLGVRTFYDLKIKLSRIVKFWTVLPNEPYKSEQFKRMDLGRENPSLVKLLSTQKHNATCDSGGH